MQVLYQGQDALSGIQRSIQRHLTETTAVNINILKDKEFEKSRKVLAARRKNLPTKLAKETSDTQHVRSLTKKKSCSRLENLKQVVQRFFKEQCGGFLLYTLVFELTMKVRKLCQGMSSLNKTT